MKDGRHPLTGAKRISDRESAQTNHKELHKKSRNNIENIDFILDPEQVRNTCTYVYNTSTNTQRCAHRKTTLTDY